MEKFGCLPTELKYMVLRLADLRDVCAMARTCKENHLFCKDVILGRSNLASSNELCRVIEKMAFENEFIRNRAARERPDNSKAQGNVATTKRETASRETRDDIDYIISRNCRILQLRHFWLAVGLADCEIISRLARETNIKEEWHSFRDLGLGIKHTHMFGNLLELAMQPPTDDLVDALLDLLTIDKSRGDAEGVNRLTEALMAAFRFGNLEIAKKLIALGTDPGKSGEGERSLMAACNYGNPFLTAKDSSIHKESEPHFQITILIAAVEGNNVEIVQYLLDNKEFINHVNSSMAGHAEALFSKAYDSHVKQEIRHMLHERLDTGRARDIVDNIEVPKWLHYAVQRNDLSMTRLLLSRRLKQVADRPASPLPERSSAEYRTGITWSAWDVMLGVALEKQSEDVAKLLLKKACSCYRLNTLSCKTRAAILDRAMRTDDKFLFSSALSINDFGNQPSGKDTLFHCIRESGAAEKLLLEKKKLGLSGKHIGIDARSQDGETPLFKNCHRNNIQMVNFLLLQKADVKAARNSERTCLQVAAEKADVILVNLLLEYGADMESESYESAKLAVEHQKWEVVEALLAKSAHRTCSSLLERQWSKGYCLVGLSMMLVRLKKYTEDMSSKLLCNVMRNPQVKLRIIDRLLAQGVDPNRQDGDEIRSPLSQACYHGRKDIAETLRNHGAIVETDATRTAPQDGQAQTTLGAAVAGGHIATVSWLLGLKEVREDERQGRDSWLSLCKVAAGGELDMLRFLLGRGNADLSSEDIRMILTEGVERGRVEIVQYLIESFGITRADINGLNLSAKGRKGRMKTLKPYLADINWR